MTGTNTSGSLARLPMRRTLSLAYRSVLDNFDILVRMSWPWLLIVLGPEIVSNWLSYPQISRNGTADPNPLPAFAYASWLFATLWPFLVLIPGSAIAVKWHQFILSNKQPSATAPLLSKELGPYLVMALLLSAASYAPIIATDVFASATAEEDGTLPWPTLAGVAVATLMLFITLRLAIVLPAIAVNGPGRSLLVAWQRTRGSMWQLVVGQLLAWVPLMALSSMVHALASLIPSRLAFALIAGVLASLSLLLLTIAVSFLSFAWRHLFDPPPAQ